MYCVFCIKDSRTVSHADQLYLALTFADLKEIVVNFELPAKARKLLTRNMCKRLSAIFKFLKGGFKKRPFFVVFYYKGGEAKMQKDYQAFL